MRLHAIKLRNLNSLYGDHFVDFDGELAEAGLILIHGPTGAGKSTLLDAICLALYGLTPRLDKPKVEAADGGDEGAGEGHPARIMSRGEGACFASVELSIETPNGETVRYRATWSLQRAHRAATGAFQKAKRKLERREGGAWKVEVESDTLKDFAPPFAEMLQGLPFADFQRTVLLAQFAFREFLDADDKARAELLERMTASAKFRDIGKAAALAKGAAEAALDKLNGKLGDLTVLTDEARAALELERGGLAASVAAVNVDIDGSMARLSYWTALIGAREQLALAAARLAETVAARSAAQVELAALAEDERLSTGRGALALWRAADSARDAATRKLAEADEARDRAARDADAATAACDEAAARHEAAKQQFAAQQPALEAARLAWAAADKASEAEVAAAQLRDARAAAAQAAIQKAAQLQDSAARLDAARDEAIAMRNAVASYAELPVAIGAIELYHSNFVGAALARDQAALAAAEKAAAHASHEARAAAVEVAARESAAAHAAAQATLTLAGDALGAATGQKTVPEALAELHARGDAARGLLSALDALERVLTDRDTAQQRLHSLRTAEQAAVVAGNEAEAEAASLDARVADKRAIAAAQDAHLRTLDHLLAVIGHRDVLQAGHACPVCGSDDHPYREHPERAPRMDDVQADAARARAAQAALKAEIDALASEATGARTLAIERQSDARTQRELAAEAQASREQLAHRATEHALASQLAVDAPPDHRASARAGAAGRVTECRLAADLVAERAKQMERAQQAADRAGQLATASESARAEHVREARALSDAAASLALEATNRQKLACDAADALSASLARVSIVADPPESGLAIARARCARVQTLTQSIEQGEPARMEAAQAAANATTTAELAASEHAAALAAHEVALAERAVTAAAAQAHLGGERPGDVAARLQALIEAERSASASARDEQSKQAQLYAGADAHRKAVADEAEQKRSGAAKARAALDEQLVAASLDSDADIDARTLTDQARAAAVLRRDALDRRQAGDEGAVSQAEQALSAHALQRAPDEPEGDPESRSRAIGDALTELKARRAELEQRVGELRGELERDAGARASRGLFEGQLQVAKADFASWKQIHDLIGVGDGAAFVRVVQALNLGAVIARANKRLAQFLPRYELAQIIHAEKGPTLDFQVVDHFHQGARRTVKSLSGGESFVVSLALALGLADMRSSTLRIETLLIDEGFGSLDPSTLAQVLAALTHLQSAIGVRIGIISHVEMLKDLIPAQILVEPAGGGRSVLRTGAGSVK